jgi:hypothetical protein
MARVIPGSAAIALLLGGCAQNYMRATVLNALPCTEDLSVVQAEDQDDGSTTWEGRGCGRRVSFTCRHPPLSRTAICVQDGPAREDASSPPSAMSR